MSSFGLNIVDDSDDLFPLPPPSPLDVDEPNGKITNRRDSSSSSSDNDCTEGDIPDNDHERAIKRRKLNEAQNERLRLIEMRERQEEQAAGVIELEAVDFRDDEPPEQILGLMQHTLDSLKKAVNPQVLELRILTLHHSDERFSFLKTDGRYRTTWERLRSETLGAKPDVQKTTGAGLGGLMGAYGESDSDSDEEEHEVPPPEPVDPPPPSPPRSPPPLPDE